ncbi:MAG: HupE/UreJ family protein [Thiolinea sp.]
MIVHKPQDKALNMLPRFTDNAAAKPADPTAHESRAVRSALLVLFTGLLCPLPAFAHAPLQGFGSFVNGFLHPLLIPAQILVLLGLGLLVGRQGSEAIRRTLPVYMLSVLGSVVLGLFYPLPLEWLLLAMALLLAAAVISGYFVPTWILVLAAVLSALLIGTDSLIADFSGRERYFALLGSVVGSSLLLIYVSGIAESLQILKDGIVLRVLGSWIAASALMVLALGFITDPQGLLPAAGSN